MEPSWSPRRRPFVRAGLLAVVIGCVGVGALIVINATRSDDTPSATDYGDATVAVTTVPRSGQLRVGANNGEKKAVACNDGHLTLYGKGIFSVTGHCASLTTGATFSQVSVERADLVNITGYDSEYFISGDFAALTVTNDGNTVQIDSVDAITLSGNDNVVSYQSGPPEVADAGDGNLIAEQK
jgi:hypothetical protein